MKFRETNLILHLLHVNSASNYIKIDLSRLNKGITNFSSNNSWIWDVCS